MTTVTLTEDEARYVLAMAEYRNGSAVASGRTDTRAAEAVRGVAMHTVGCATELAVRKLLGMDITLPADTYKTLPDLDPWPVDVKGREFQYYNAHPATLNVAPRDLAPGIERYVHAVLAGGTFGLPRARTRSVVVYGWAARDTVIAARTQDYGGRGQPIHTVEADDLEPMETVLVGLQNSGPAPGMMTERPAAVTG